MRVFSSAADLADAVGQDIGPGPWHPVEQARVDTFAAATGDDQWIHTDPARAAAGPFGGTIAHGYLTLSLLPLLVRDLYRFEGARMVVNYGLDKVRFPAPVPVGASVRLSAQVVSVAEAGGGVQVTARMTVESDRSAKPCCVAETVTRVFFS
ncbi:MaoC family dehydratase [Catellatospora methionotrophica]|uniref:MaoC family dehydratase n=1 Tax=Catellatospora methionotrophica TaxID=121620 RepID=A0A8J3LL18_9ACTN|nr:MaoC family dehydratase [Catellatospora methionotrophica]GIG17589.1 MaoC family dehydratase [Catellatospora methionotrophica]